jgi:thiamine-monophosphate kinase
MTLNISDIGAMGGMPRFALVSLGLKGESPVKDVEDMYRGFLDELNPLEAAIVGGNLTKSGDRAFIDITLIGEVEPVTRLCRSGARPGDAILVTGRPGQAAAGLEILLKGKCPEHPMDHPIIRAYLGPSHRAREGRAIAKAGYATAMIDTSDGFLGDLGHICEASHVGAELWQANFPLGEDLKQVAAALERDPLDLFLGESDDYELIITCSPDGVKPIEDALASIGTVAISEVGRMTGEEGNMVLIREDTSKERLTPSGWDHFKH